MNAVARFAAFLVAVLIATSAWAQARSVEGSVGRVDRDTNVVVLQDGQAVRVGPSTVITHQGQTTTITGLQPGMRVVIREGEPVTQRDGRDIGQAQPSAQPMQPRVTVNQEQMTTTVQAPPARLSVDVPPSRVIVQQQPAEILVRQAEPQVQMQPAPQPQVRIEQQPRTQAPGQVGAQAQQPSMAQQQPMQQQPMQQQPAASPPTQVQEQQQEMTTTVQAPPSRIAVDVPPTRVIVQQQPAEIVVRQPEPEVTVQPAPQPRVRFEGPRAEAAPPAASVAAQPRPAEGQVAQQQPWVLRTDFPPAATKPAPAVSPWCEGAYAEKLGSNFGSCVRPVQ